jgi:hypothetical protein
MKYEENVAQTHYNGQVAKLLPRKCLETVFEVSFFRGVWGGLPAGDMTVCSIGVFSRINFGIALAFLSTIV